MTKDDLSKIIRSIVREEVDRALLQLMKENVSNKLQESRGVVPQQQRQPIPQAPKRGPLVSLESPLKAPPVSTKTFCSNPTLNAVLQQTVGGVPTQEEVDATGTPSVLDTINNLPQEVLNENADVAGVVSVMNKDFRSLVKAMDKAAARIRP